MKALHALVLMLWIPVTAAMDARDAQGLQVAVEHLEPLEVDGVAMHVQRAHGRDIERLARRIEQRWQTERGAVLQSRHSDWQVRSRWSGLRSEVIQWRGAGHGAELLFSWFDVAARPATRAAAPVDLPPQCMWVRSITGVSHPNRYLQMTARCRTSPAQLQERLPAILRRHDWNVVHRGLSAWDVARRHESARVAIVAGADDGESAIVWLATAPGARP